MKCNRGRYFCMGQSIHVGVSRVTALLLMAYSGAPNDNFRQMKILIEMAVCSLSICLLMCKVDLSMTLTKTLSP